MSDSNRPPAATPPLQPEESGLDGPGLDSPGLDNTEGPGPGQLRWRYWRVLLFFVRVLGSIFLFDYLLNRPYLQFLRPAEGPRWIAYARRFRAVAAAWGGIWIKLGQYLSTRADILPTSITRELRGLQDEVPAAPFAAIREQVEREFHRPVERIFASLDAKPLGAASFAQVHAARLPDGHPVVVKVLRPGIEALVDVDLAALAKVLAWASLLPMVSRRVDLHWLQREFSETTLRELDLMAEGHHAERFADNFKNDPAVRIPQIFWGFSSRRVLTEENVAFIKITDVEAMRGAGIDPREVARKLYRVFMEQIFVHNFVHADPHPGNLFVRVQPDPSAAERLGARAAEWAKAATEAAASVMAGEPIRSTGGAPFQIYFIDFGMVAEIPPRLRAALRKFLIGLGTRDAAQVIQAFRDAGSLLPGADLAQLEEALETVFDRFWGADLSHLHKMLLTEAMALWKEFGQLLRETPIQVQVDLMFVGRALEILSGITTELDPEMNPWVEAVPFAQYLASETSSDVKAQVADGVRQLRLLAKLPGELSRTVGLAQRGRLTFRTAMAPDLRRQLERLERNVGRLNDTVVIAALLVAGAFLYREEPDLGKILLATALAMMVWSRIVRR